MHFAILGPVEVRHDGQLLPVGSGRERFVLATLLLNADRLTPADTLIDALWDEPPPSAKAQLYNMISNLRRRLAVGSRGLIVSRSVGYELCLRGHELDLLQFRRLAARGRQAAVDGDHPVAVSVFTEALSLWRGPALADVADEPVAGVRQALHEERLAAAEARLDSELALGHNDSVLRELHELVAEHPYREGLHERRLMALVGAGRRADALAGYRRVYRQFVDELGVQPGASLRNLEQRVLRGEIPAPARAAAGPAVPRQLPPPIATLTGRDKLLGEITGVLRCMDDRAPPVVLLVGPGGVGKTALALAAANGVGDAFPDGQLYADLRGNHGNAVDPHAVLGRFLRALGVDGSMLPDERDERIAMYRSHLAGKRALVVLDDAATEEQARPLVPGTPSCRAVVTSRHRLGALVGAARWTIPVLTTTDALELLARIVGRERVIAEPAAASAIVELCARLPLAVSIAAARLAVRPHWTLEEFRQRLAEERGRLDELSVGDLDVRASIGLSYRALDPGPRELFRRLGLVSAPDWPAWVADALVGGGPTARALDQLVDAHLVEPLGRDAVGQSRFRLHDLVAAFAGERALAEDRPDERAAALRRLLAGWLALATEADERVPHGLVRAPDADTPPPPPAAASLARETPSEWFEAERRSLLSAVGQACRSGWPDVAGALALRLSGFLGLRSYDDEWDGTLRQAISCVASHAGTSGHLLARLLAALFIACLRRDRYAELSAMAAEELAVARGLGDRELEVRALTHAGLAAGRLCRFDEARAWLEQAVAMARRPDVADRLLRDGLDILAFQHMASGRPWQALPLLEEALDIDRDPKTALHLYHYGLALARAGRPIDAEPVLAEALHVSREMGSDLGSAYLEQALADVDIRRGRWSVAAERLDRALRAHEQIGSGDGLAETLRSMGDLAAAQARWADAIAWTRRALDIWRRIGSPVEITRTLARLERACSATGDDEAARSYGRECRAILADLQLDDAGLYLPALPGDRRC